MYHFKSCYRFIPFLLSIFSPLFTSHDEGEYCPTEILGIKLRFLAVRSALQLVLCFIQYCWSWSTPRSGFTSLLFVQVVLALFKGYYIIWISNHFHRQFTMVKYNFIFRQNKSRQNWPLKKWWNLNRISLIGAWHKCR